MVDWQSNLLIAIKFNRDIIVDNVLVVKSNKNMFNIDDIDDINNIYYNKIQCIRNCTQGNDLPVNLKTLHFDDTFNDPVDLTYMIHLKFVRFGKKFDHPLEGKLPTNLKVLEFSRHSIFSYSINLSHTQCKRLTLGTKCNNTLILPDTLETLILGFNYVQNITHLPSQLRYLDLGYRFNHDIDFSTCVNLRILRLSHYYNHSLDSKLPESLQHLKIGAKIIHPIIYLPDNIHTIVKYNSAPIYYPKNLKNLYIHNKHPPINITDLPMSLKYLFINLTKINVDNYRQLECSSTK